MRITTLLVVVVLISCGTPVATTAKPTPTPSPDIAALYTDAIQTTHDALVSDYAAISAATQGSAAQSTAAGHIAGDFQSLLVKLDAIPFPPNAQEDLSALKKSVVALQIFWSDVAINADSYSSFTENNLSNAYAQTALVLGHDIGVTLVIQGPSPSP